MILYYRRHEAEPSSWKIHGTQILVHACTPVFTPGTQARDSSVTAPHCCPRARAAASLSYRRLSSSASPAPHNCVRVLSSICSYRATGDLNEVKQGMEDKVRESARTWGCLPFMMLWWPVYEALSPISLATRTKNLNISQESAIVCINVARHTSTTCMKQPHSWIGLLCTPFESEHGHSCLRSCACYPTRGMRCLVPWP